MKLFTQENIIVCGKCNTQFDLNKNKAGCPLCGFGGMTTNEEGYKLDKTDSYRRKNHFNYLDIPPQIKLKSGRIISDDETEQWGSWLMFNDYFVVKFLGRVLAWKIHNEKSDFVNLKSLIEDAKISISINDLSKFKGFPKDIPKDIKNNSSIGRLVYHFLITGIKMGLFDAKTTVKNSLDVWKESWDNIEISLTQEGLEFSRLKNYIFDEGKVEQILTSEEKNWIVNYLIQIDKKGYREYSVLKKVYDFLKQGHNGKNDLWSWFESNKQYQDYIKQRSRKARESHKIFQKQLSNYARSFASSKVSLLRELGVVKNKRNNYAIVGEL